MEVFPFMSVDDRGETLNAGILMHPEQIKFRGRMTRRCG
jgi:hypothetical protein